MIIYVPKTKTIHIHRAESKPRRPQKKTSKPSILNIFAQTKTTAFTMLQGLRKHLTSWCNDGQTVGSLKGSLTDKTVILSKQKAIEKEGRPCVNGRQTNWKHPLIHLPWCQIPVWWLLKGCCQTPYGNRSRSLMFPLPPLEWQSPSSLYEAPYPQDSGMPNPGS